MFNKIVPVFMCFSFSLFWILPNPANAQNCTTLEGQGTTNCPSPPQGSGNNPPFIGGQDNSIWEARWGAISVDNSNNTYGTADGYKSKSAASKAAIDDCKKWGGKACKISIAYYNQCGVLLSGENYSITGRGPTIDAAIGVVIDECKKHDPKCKLYHAGCSYSQKVR